MTGDSLSETAALRALLSEASDTHLLAEVPGFVADRLMALDVDQPCRAGAHERSAGRVNHRNHCPAGECMHSLRGDIAPELGRHVPGGGGT